MVTLSPPFRLTVALPPLKVTLRCAPVAVKVPLTVKPALSDSVMSNGKLCSVSAALPASALRTVSVPIQRVLTKPAVDWPVPMVPFAPLACVV